MHPMVEHTAEQTRKRRLESGEEEESPQHRSPKKLKTEIRHRYPPRFWDSLSQIRLTRGALKKLDRRHIQEGFTRTTPLRRKTCLLRSDYHRLSNLASNGEPDLRSLRGYSKTIETDRQIEMRQSSSQSRKGRIGASTSRSDMTGKSSTTSPYSGEFEQKLIDRGVYPEGHRINTEKISKPANFVELRDNLARTRASLSLSTFSEDAFENFQDANRRAKSESHALAEIIAAITGANEREHEYAEDLLFTRLKKFDPDISIPKPDRYYGAKPAEIDHRVRRELNKYIIPSDRTTIPPAPNFFLEGKSAAGRPDVVQRQAMYDGAIGARGMLYLQNYGNPTLTCDGNAYTISSTCHPSTGTLQMYVTYPRQSETRNKRTEYHMTQLDTYGMTGNINSFRQGATAYRNARDWAKRQRDQFIANANAVARRRSRETASIMISRDTKFSDEENRDSPDSDTSMDELAPEYDHRKRQRRCQSVNHER